jgi:copper chaperone CopZ
MKVCIHSAVFAVMAFVMTTNTARAVSPDTTRITVKKMHCAHCAKGMADHLYKVAGVAKVETNVEAKMMFVTPKPQTALSPRALWEAIEKAAQTPVKLEGPQGTFTAKPQS